MNVRFRIKGTAVYVDPVKAPARADSGTPYTTVGYGGRSQRWRPAAFGPNAALDYSAITLRNQSRELVRKNALAASAVERIVSNTVGTGIKPKLSDAALTDVWKAWTDVSAADGQLDFYGQQQQVMRAVVEAGECFIRLRNRLPVDGLVVPLQLEILEPEFVPIAWNMLLPSGNEVRQGIEFDAVLKAKRVAYWIYPKHPNDKSLEPDQGIPLRVPASEILHVFWPGRPGQIRGEPWFARVLDRMQDIETYDKAELLKKRIAALYVGFIRRPTPEGMSIDDLAELYGDEGAKASGLTAEVALEAGTMQTLLPGEDVEFANPPDVGQQYEVFMRGQQRAIAAALGLLYEQLTGDYSQVNDRTWRAAVTEFRRRCEGWQHHLLVFQMCRPVWRRWADLAVLNRAAPRTLDATAPVDWTPPAWPYINPVQDIQAAREEMLAGVRSRTEVVSSMGSDASRVDEEQAADNDRADELGLIYESDGRVLLPRAPAGFKVAKDPAAPVEDPLAGNQQAQAATARIDQRISDMVAALRPPKPEPAPVSNLTYTEIEGRDERGRITSLLKRPISGDGPVIRRQIVYDDAGRMTSVVETEAAIPRMEVLDPK